MQFALDKAALHHVEKHSDHDVQQLTLFCDVPSQLLVAEELNADVNDSVGHGVRLVTLHEGLHNEGIVLDKRFSEGDLRDGGKRHLKQLIQAHSMKYC